MIDFKPLASLQPALVPSLLLSLVLLVPVAGAGETRSGLASYYADSLQGNATASGEPYDKDAYTAAHRTLPLGSLVRVTYLKTGKSVEVRINDRGPRTQKREIDLSRAAAQAIGMIDDGVGEVRLEVLD